MRVKKLHSHESDRIINQMVRDVMGRDGIDY